MELLTKLYCIHSKSGREKKIKKFIAKWVSENVPEASITFDAIGNMYITKGVSVFGTYPVVVAHLDQVQNDHSRDFQALIVGDIIVGYSQKSRAQQGLGADDKNGIWVCLKCLQKYNAIKIALFVSEEVGCVGSESADMSFFNDARFVLQCDRRGAKDLITNAGWTELCSKDFIEAIQPSMFGYKPTNGMLTDVLTLKCNGLAVSCVNISCGYYEPHTDCEITNTTDLLNCLSFVEHIIENCIDVYPHKYQYAKYYNKYDEIYDDYCSGFNSDSFVYKEETFVEKYWDDVKEALTYKPNAPYDMVLAYLKIKYPKTYFWHDWTFNLYARVKKFLEKRELKDSLTTTDAATID